MKIPGLPPKSTWKSWVCPQNLTTYLGLLPLNENPGSTTAYNYTIVSVYMQITRHTNVQNESQPQISNLITICVAHLKPANNRCGAGLEGLFWIIGGYKLACYDFPKAVNGGPLKVLLMGYFLRLYQLVSMLVIYS